MNIWNYTFIAITMMLFMQFAGFPTGLGTVFDFFGLEFNTDNSVSGFGITTSGFEDYLFNSTTGLLATLAGVGVTIGLLVSGRIDMALYAGVCSAVLFMFLPSLAFMLIYAIEADFSPWVTSIIALIAVPLSVGYIIALINYIGGRQ